MGGAVAEGPSISDARLFARESALLVVLPGLLLLALPVLCGVTAGAGETLIGVRLSVGGGFAASFDTVLFSVGVDELPPGAGGVPGLGEPARVAEPAGPPSLASLRKRICSIVSWSGASGVADGGGCSVGSIFWLANSEYAGVRMLTEGGLGGMKRERERKKEKKEKKADRAQIPAR